MADTLNTKLVSLQNLADFKSLNDAKRVADIAVETARAQGVEGTLDNLTTDAKGNLVAAINELDSHIDTNTTAIGVEPAEGVTGSGLRKRVKDLEDAVGSGGSVDSKIQSAIEALDSEKSSADVEEGKGLQVTVKEVDGKIDSVTLTGSFDNKYDALNAASTVKSEVIGTAADTKDADTIKGSKAYSDANLVTAKSYTDTEIQKLDTTADVVTASVSNGVVTLTAGIAETDGIIAKGSGADITLAKVATTGTASDIALVDEAGKITATNVEDALTEIVGKADTNASNIAKLNGAVTADGSVLKMIHDNAKDAKYGTKTVEGETVEISIEQAIKDAEAAAKEAGVVTVEKQASAESGYAATYYVKQNGVKVGDSINIAKDWLLKTVTIKTCAEVNVPEQGYAVGDRYFDFEFNTKDSSETTTHVYLKVEEMYDAYTTGSVSTDAVVIVVDNDTNKISATVTDGTIGRAKIDSTFEGQIAAVETALQKDTDGTYKTVSTRIDEEAASATYKAAGEGTAKVTVGGAIGALETLVGTTAVATQISTAVNDLDATVTQSSTDTNPVAVSVTETDGKLTAISASVVTASATDINALFTTETQS